MDVIYARCCGLDVHKRGVVACLVTPGPDRVPTKEIRAFTTMTDDLLALSDWLTAAGCTHVAMESTGVYWKPVYNLLEDGFALLLVNARHVKAVPGRKTNAKDGEWLAGLLRHGLLQASFVPDRSQRELRELTRYRTSLVRERTAAANRLQKTLEGANIKLAAVATDILGKSGREILAALVDFADGSGGPCAVGARPAAGEAARVGAGANWVRCGAPALPPRRAVGPRRLPGRGHRSGGRSGGRAPAAGRSGDCQPRYHSGDRPPHCRGLGRGDRDGHGAVPDRASPCLVGGDVSGQPRECRETTERQDAQGQSLAPRALGAGRTRGADEGHLSRGSVPPFSGASGKSRAAVALGHTILVIAFHLLRDGTTYRDLGPTYFD